MEHQYWTYIMASTSGTLYIGMTSDIELRVRQHKMGIFEGFSKKYHCTRLVYREEYDQVFRAIAREKQLKGWRRSKKIALIETQNPRWQDLAAHIDREIEATEKFQEQLRTAAVAGSFDSGVRPRSG